ncbi:hypothetical protein GCM10011369_02370 [Neiella marina]|uniref:Glycosyltransferase 2-like domain-containing protein n=1 Tax=Neiella marina TaxID=508461 RepID=A0A8J2U1V4_9GAMM|nr:glycosyltransferase [Neiella marina]GGA64529.1 hypothetical protein GCM10011369_02370 [Neiella marina]
MTTAMPAKLSVVIPSYQSQAHLRRTLEALVEQLEQCDAEIIVVDCSPGTEVDDICDAFNAVQLIKCQQRFNPGSGRNIGADAASGEALVFIDADVVMQAGALSAIARRVAAGNDIFGGALELAPGDYRTFASYIEHYFFNHEAQASRQAGTRPNLSSAMMIVRRDLFIEIGGFSDIPRMQDTEMTERLVAKGYQLGFFPEIVGFQVQDSSLSKVFKKIFINGNNLYFLRYQQAKGLGYKILLGFTLPLLMMAKVTRINFRNMKYAGSAFMLLALCPFMYLCGSAWMFGFYKGLLISNGIAAGR